MLDNVLFSVPCSMSPTYQRRSLAVTRNRSGDVPDCWNRTTPRHNTQPSAGYLGQLQGKRLSFCILILEILFSTKCNSDSVE